MTRSQSNTSTPFLGIIILWILACILALFRLGDLPLRDFDEGIVARVAYELSFNNGFDQFFPTLWGSQYLNKPPGLHWLIAIAMKVNEALNPIDKLPNEFVVRVFPALISTFVVPIGGLIQWHLRPGDKNSSLTTSGILLTLLPIARHGRLAMLDGTFLSLMGLFWLLIITKEKGIRSHWKAGIAGLTCSGMLLLKAPLIIPAVLAGVFPTLLSKNLKHWLHGKTITWLILGILPGITWHVFHYLNRGVDALWLWGGDGAIRVLFNAGEGSDLGWKVPVIEIFEGGWPWLLLWPFGMIWAWNARKSDWGKWVICTQIILALTIFPLKTQLPWYSHPLWLPFALICGPPLAWLIHQNNPGKHPIKSILIKLPLIFATIGLLLILCGVLGQSKAIFALYPYRLIAISTGIGWGIGGWLTTQSSKKKRSQGIVTIFSGSFIGLLVLMNSSFWLWELNENWPVKPAAQLAVLAKGENVVIDEQFERPSLNWYAGQKMNLLKEKGVSKWILTRKPQFLIENQDSQNCLVAKEEEEWSLLLCQPKTN